MFLVVISFPGLKQKYSMLVVLETYCALFSSSSLVEYHKGDGVPPPSPPSSTQVSIESAIQFHSICGTTTPSGPQRPSEDASILLHLLLISSILVFLGSVMFPSGRCPPILFLVFSAHPRLF